MLYPDAVAPDVGTPDVGTPDVGTEVDECVCLGSVPVAGDAPWIGDHCAVPLFDQRCVRMPVDDKVDLFEAIPYPLPKACRWAPAVHDPHRRLPDPFHARFGQNAPKVVSIEIAHHAVHGRPELLEYLEHARRDEIARVNDRICLGQLGQDFIWDGLDFQGDVCIADYAEGYLRHGGPGVLLDRIDSGKTGRIN